MEGIPWRGNAPAWKHEATTRRVCAGAAHLWNRQSGRGGSGRRRFTAGLVDAGCSVVGACRATSFFDAASGHDGVIFGVRGAATHKGQLSDPVRLLMLRRAADGDPRAPPEARSYRLRLAQEDAGEDPGGVGSGFIFIGNGFAAHYPDAIWTNAHIAEAVRAAMGVVEDDAGNVTVTLLPVAVRSGGAIGGAHTHRLNMDTVRIYPGYDPEPLHSPDRAVFHLDDQSLRDVTWFLPPRPRRRAAGRAAGRYLGVPR